MARRKFVTVYLLHFETPLAHARHYIGSAKDLAVRLEQHRRGTGARLMQVLREQGIGWMLARTWRGPRLLEKTLKAQHNAPRLCPLCNSALRVAHQPGVAVACAIVGRAA